MYDFPSLYCNEYLQFTMLHSHAQILIENTSSAGFLEGGNCPPCPLDFVHPVMQAAGPSEDAASSPSNISGSAPNSTSKFVYLKPSTKSGSFS